MKKVNDLYNYKPRPTLIVCLAVLTVAVYLLVVSPVDNNLHVSILDVGQGDAILIQKGNRQVLIDGGPNPQVLNLRLGEKMPFWDRTIELVMLTHPSSDHVTGLVDVLDKYRVDMVACPEMNFDGSEVFDRWLQILENKECRFRLLSRGQTIHLGRGVILEVLNPGKTLLNDTISDADNNGMVLRLSLGDISFLFTADIMWEAELDLVHNRAGMNSNVLKVAHHGSETSTTEQFLSVVNPDVAVLSVGKDNEYGHPDNTVEERIAKEVGVNNYYRTDECGTVEFITDGHKLWVNKG